MVAEAMVFFSSLFFFFSSAPVHFYFALVYLPLPSLTFSNDTFTFSLPSVTSFYRSLLFLVSTFFSLTSLNLSQPFLPRKHIPYF